MPKKCRTCCQPIAEKPIREDQSRSGVAVTVLRFKSGTVVEADCSCFGAPFRLHSNEKCPRLRRKKVA